MDKHPMAFDADWALLSNSFNNVFMSGSYDINDYASHHLRLSSYGGKNPSFSDGEKRKLELVDGSSLALGLGNSSSSCITTSYESLGDLDLTIGLLGDKRAPNSIKVSNDTANAHQSRKTEIDLELSLSTGPAEPDISRDKGSSPSLKTLLPPTSRTTGQLVDEGSTSSRWKCGSLLTPLPSLETVAFVDQNQNHYHQIVAASSTSTSPVETTKSLDAFASGAVHQEPRRSNVKICLSEGCTRGARGASGLCIAHGGGRRCQRIGCQKGAEGKTVFCKAHGGGRRCQHLGCTKSAEGHTEYCIGHGGGRRCCHLDCTRAARGKSGLCIRHGGGKRCKVESCTKSAEGISGLCISHGGGRRCQYPSCTKGAQGSTMFCKAHGGGRRCTYLGCTKGAEGSTPFCKGHGGGKRCTAEGCTKSVHGGTMFCVSHGGGKRCASSGCTKSARGRTNFCVRHGGGKRCKHEGCTKSAQGSTDYCKAHGGGKRCSWGQLGSNYGGEDAVPCDKFARGKSGLCAAHASQLQENLLYHSCATSTQLHDVQSSAVYSFLNSADGVSAADGDTTSVGLRSHGSDPLHMQLQDNFTLGCAHLNEFSLPEGRVHGGSLMAMLRGDAPPQFGNSSSGAPLDHGKSFMLPHSLK